MSEYIIPRDDELYHYGILGMKWGIRKERSISGRKNKHKKIPLKTRYKKIHLTKAEKIALGIGGAGLAAGAGLGIAALATKIKANKLANQYMASTMQKPVMGVSKVPQVNKLLDSMDKGMKAENLGYAGLTAASAGLIPVAIINNSHIRERYGLNKKKERK